MDQITDDFRKIVAVYSVVIAQWYHDVYQKVTPSGYENNLYRCLPTGALDYVKVCAFGCNVTALGEDDRCLPKGTCFTSVVIAAADPPLS